MLLLAISIPLLLNYTNFLSPFGKWEIHIINVKPTNAQELYH